MEYITFTAGRLLCGKIRSFLDQEIFKGRQIEYIESKGLLEREFTVMGSCEDIVYINACLYVWAKKNGLFD